MTAERSEAKSSAGPDPQRLDRAGQPLVQSIRDVTVDEHACRSRALLPGEPERALDDRGNRVVQVRVGIDDHAVLAAHLRDHPLDVVLSRRLLGGDPDDAEPGGDRSGEGDDVHLRVRDERLSRLIATAQELQHVGRNAGGVQRLDDSVTARGRLLRGLEDDGVAGDERRGHHPGRDRQRKVPRCDHRTDAPREVAQRVALSGKLDQRPALLQCRPLPPRNTRGSRSPRRRRRPPPPTACPPRARRAPPVRAGARVSVPPLAAARSRVRRPRARTTRGRRSPPARPLRPPPRPRPRMRSRSPRRGPPGWSRRALQSPVSRVVAAACARSSCKRAQRLRAHRFAAKLKHRLVAKRALCGQGLSSSRSSSAPVVWAARNDSFEVFSSRRLTR